MLLPFSILILCCCYLFLFSGENFLLPVTDFLFFSNYTGTTIPPTTSTLAQTLSEDPAQEMEDIRRRSFAVLQPICSALLAHRNDSAKLSKLLLELQQVLLNLEPAGVQSCVDYVIFPLQVALDAIAATRGGGGGSSSGDGGAPTTSTPSTTAAFPALKSDKTAEAALSALLILLQKGTECTRGDQLLSLLHRLCGILALPREAVSEEIRLGTLKIVIAAVTNVPYNEALQFSVREESSAPLIGHLGSVLVKAAAAEVEAGSGIGSKRIRIEALKALKLLIQAVNDAEALSFFLPGLITGLARALLVAGGGGRGGGVSRSYGSPAVSGAATVEALHGLTSLLQATLGNDSIADLLLNNEDISTAGGAVEGVDADEAAESQQQWGNLTGDAALEELYKLSNKKIGKISSIKENTITTKNELPSPPPPSPSTKTPTITAPPQHGESPKLRVDRTQEWVRTSSTRIIEMLNTVLPPLASDAKANVREALVHTCGTLSVCCSLALSGCVSTLTDIILALAQDSWPSVATAARSWLNTSTTTKAAAAVPYELKASLPTTTFSCVPILATAEESLKTWLDDLPAALRRGDEAGKGHALKITTCLETCPPQWIVNHLLSHSTEVGRLIHVFAECFAVDVDSVGLLLVAAPEPGGTAFTTAATASGPSGSSNTGPSTVSIALPRMPLCLHSISTQKSYECIANLVRTLAAVAVAADNADESENSAGTALRSLIDGCLQHIHNLVDSASSTGMGTQSGGSRAKLINRPGAGVKKNKKNKGESSFSAPMEIDSSPSTECSWTVSAAQIVFVLTEIIFGASSTWKPTYSLLSTAATTPSSSSSSSAKLNTKTKELEALIALALPELVDSRIWSLPTAITNTTATTSTAVTAALPSSSPGFTSKDRGSNALLQCAILDCIGTSARALNLQFTSNGRLLRFILLPIMEKMGDPCPIVASAADSTIQAICTFCGYSTSTGGGLRQLVADNADYIVDGLCRQLRQPENFPLAPQLFAALLGQGGVAPGLVPLLAEPARQALLGISIVARKKKPEHVLSFVLCLREIARGAGLVGQETCAELESYAALVEERREFLLEMIKEKKIQEEISKNKIGVVEEVVEEPSTSPSLEQNLKSSGRSNDKMDEINKYFKDHLAQKQKRTAGAGANVSGGGGIDGQEDMEEDVEDDIKVPLLLEEWNQIQISRRKAASCATLAQSSADTAGPLILSSSLPVAIQSIKTCSEALEALKYASKGVEICAKRIDPVIMPPNGIIGPTPDPTTAAFLPSVHLLWSPLMGALSDWRVAVVESVLLMLSHISQLAGSFLTRRFSEEAWPIMAKLLKEGPSQKRIIAPGQDDLSSPAVLQRAQHAVLACVRSMATGGPGPEAIISPVAASALVAAADLMGGKHPAMIRENATTAFVALSKVDPDAAWGLLVAAIRSSHSAATMASKRLEVVVVEDFVGLPTMAEICTAPPSGSEKFVPIGLKTCGETKLLALLKQVNELPVGWHQDIEKLLSI